MRVPVTLESWVKTSVSRRTRGLQSSPPVGAEHLVQGGGPHRRIKGASDSTLPEVPPAWRSRVQRGSRAAGGERIGGVAGKRGARLWAPLGQGHGAGRGRGGAGAPGTGETLPQEEVPGLRSPSRKNDGATPRRGEPLPRPEPRPPGTAPTPRAGRAGVTAKRGAERRYRQFARGTAAAHVRTRPGSPHTPLAAAAHPRQALSASTLPVADPAVTSSPAW